MQGNNMYMRLRLTLKLGGNLIVIQHYELTHSKSLCPFHREKALFGLTR